MNRFHFKGVQSKEINNMKLFQKSLLFASLLTVGAGVVSAPVITNGNGVVQAATTSKSNKKMVSSDFYYRVGKDKLIKAVDVKLLDDTTNADTNMDNMNMPDNLKLEVSTPEAVVYNLKDKATSERLAKGTECIMGDQEHFFNDSYYRESKNKMIHVTDSTWA